MKINQMIEYERLKRGMTQEEFAQFLGVSRGTLAHHERGRNISLKLMKLYAQKLGDGLLVEYAKEKLGGLN